MLLKNLSSVCLHHDHPASWHARSRMGKGFLCGGIKIGDYNNFHPTANLNIRQ